MTIYSMTIKIVEQSHFGLLISRVDVYVSYIILFVILIWVFGIILTHTIPRIHIILKMYALFNVFFHTIHAMNLSNIISGIS